MTITSSRSTGVKTTAKRSTRQGNSYRGGIAMTTPRYRREKTRKDILEIPRGAQAAIDTALRKEVSALRSEVHQLKYQNKTMMGTTVFMIAWFGFFLIGYLLGWW